MDKGIFCTIFRNRHLKLKVFLGEIKVLVEP